MSSGCRSTYLVEQRFYELVRAQRQLQVFSEAATRSRDQANYTQRLFEGGRATQATSMRRGRTRQRRSDASGPGAQRGAGASRSVRAIGLDPGTPLTVTEPPNMLAGAVQAPALPRPWSAR